MKKFFDANKIKEIIFEAGNILLGSRSEELSVSSKPGDANFVTEYDVAVQEFLIGKFSSLIPEAEFLSEEMENTSLKGGLFFIIDPIDGTTNFIHGYNHSAISVALCENGYPVFGAVLNPYSGEMFSACENEGAFLQKNGGRAVRIHVSRRKISDSLVSFGTSPYRKHLADITFDTVKKLYLASRDIRRSGSAALDICYVACGRCDLFFEAVLSPWDYAAGSVIVKEAGGIISQTGGGGIDFPLPSSILAANELAYEDFLNLCGDVF